MNTTNANNTTVKEWVNAPLDFDRRTKQGELNNIINDVKLIKYNYKLKTVHYVYSYMFLCLESCRHMQYVCELKEWG